MSRAPRKQESAWIAARPPSRGGPLAPLSQVLADTQKQASSRSGSAISPDEWRRIVGAKIASRTRVGSLKRGSLTIFTASSAWCNELSFLKSEVIGKLRYAGYEVTDLRVRVGAFEEPSPQATPRSPRPRNSTPPLPPEIQQSLAKIDDPELRLAIAEAAALSLAAQRRGRE